MARKMTKAYYITAPKVSDEFINLEVRTPFFEIRAVFKNANKFSDTPLKMFFSVITS